MTAPSHTPGTDGESPGENARSAVNDVLAESAAATTGTSPQSDPADARRSRRERRDRDQATGPGDGAPDEAEPLDDVSGPGVVTPPPRPAPRASVFKGLRMIELRTDPEDPDADPPDPLDPLDLPDPLDLDEPAVAAPASRSPAGSSPGAAAPAAEPAARSSGLRAPRAPAKPGQLGPARWPTPPVFMPPEPASKRSPARPARAAASTTAAQPAPAPSASTTSLTQAEPVPAPAISPIQSLLVDPAPREATAAPVPVPVAATGPLTAPKAPASHAPPHPANDSAPPDAAPAPVAAPTPAPAPPTPVPATRRQNRSSQDRTAEPGTTVARTGTPRAERERPSGSRRRPRAPGRWQARRLKAALYLIPLLGTLVTLLALLYGAITLPVRPLLGSMVLVVAAAVLGAIATTAAEVHRATPSPLIGAELGRAEHARLWAAATAATDELGVDAPARIVVDGAARVALSRRPAGHELVIGLPLLMGLSELELSALVIHELAHDAAPGAAIHRLGERVDATLRQLSGDRRWSRRPARVLTRWYSRCYLRLATAANEQHELVADDVAGELTSPRIAATAILRTELIRERWQTLVTRFLPLSAIARRRAPLGDGLRSLLDLPVSAAPALLDGPAPLEEGARLPFDAHRLPQQRADRLAAGADPATGTRARKDAPATDLLAGGEQALPALEQAVLPDTDPAADWQTIVELAAGAQAQERTGHLAWALRDLGVPEPITLAAVLTVLGAGDGPRIVAPLLPPGILARQRPAAAQALLEELLAAFVVTVLLRSGRARHEVTWPGGVRLLRRSGSSWVTWDGDDPIRSGTADPAGSAALRRWLRDIQAGLDLQAQPSAGPPLHLLSALSDLELSLPFEHRAVDLLIYRTGILLAPIEVPTPAGRLAQQATHTLRRQSPASIAAARIGSLAEQLGESPQDLPGGWWMPVGSMASGQIRERRNGTDLQLRLSDGASSTLRTTNRTTPRGPAMDDLTRLLPAPPA